MLCGLTYSAHPMGCACTCAALKEYKEKDIAGNVNKVGKVLGEILEDLKNKHKCVGEVRYIGLFSGIELVKAPHEPLVPYGKDPEGKMAKICGMLKKEGFSTYSHESVLIVAPPLIITEEQLKEQMKTMDKVLDSVDKMI